MKKLILLLTILLITLIALQVQAANWGLDALSQTGLPQGTPGAFIAKVVSYIMGFIGVVLIVVIIYGGFLYMTSRGNEKQLETAKNVLTYAIVGIVIVFASYIIARFVISALTAGSTQSPSQQSTEEKTPINCLCENKKTGEYATFGTFTTTDQDCQTICNNAGYNKGTWSGAITPQNP